jgi:hypothetical protein
MTRRERLLWLLMLAVLLVGGPILGRLLGAPPEGRADAVAVSTDVRVWLWERRVVDLIAQVGLIFAGALGVAALLPSNARRDPDGDLGVPGDTEARR